MIQPTRRAIVLVAAAAPLSLAVAALDADLWPIGLTYLLFVLALIAFDSARALPIRRLSVSVRPIDSLFIGEPANLEIGLSVDWPNLPHSIEARLDIAPIVDAPPLSRAARGLDHRGAGTWSMICAITCSTVMPSISAPGARTRRWRRQGTERNLTSSGIT